jgi:3-hydroxyisobutyrate dehydrogenase/glyoxylate/succinic semialdehyde reductase
MKVAFIGTGIMGSCMAHNLLKNGYNLIVHNRTKEKAEGLIEEGAEWADSPAEAGKKADILFTMLSNPEAVKEVALGKNGFFPEMNKGSLWIDCSTINPDLSQEMSIKASEKGIRFMDAPVSGTRQPAEKGELIFFVGGDKKDFEEVQPLLQKMGKKIIHLGKAGMGTSMKMVVNLLLGESMASFSEAMVLGKALGFNKDTLFEVILGGPVAAPYLSAKKEKFANDKYDPDFPLQWMVKDLKLISETAVKKNLSLPAINAVMEEFAKANQKGFGEQDFSVLYQYLSGNNH